MRALLITPTHNSAGKRDVSGAFGPEARAYAANLRALGHEVTIRQFDNRASKTKRRVEVEAMIRSGTWGTVALFCHGLASGIQTGHDLRTVGSLADALAAASSGPLGVTVFASNAGASLNLTLYACDAGDTRVRAAPGGDGGMADALRDALAARGVRGHLDAHVTTGHATKNPYVRRFVMAGGPSVGGEYLVAPGSPKWRAWIRALKGDMRWRFPWLTPAEIDGAL